MPINTRTVATKIATAVLNNETSLMTCDQRIPSDMVSADRAFVKALVFGLCRHYWSLLSIAEQLLSKPLRQKDRDIHTLLLLGVYQLKYLNTPAHAAISECVESCRQLKKSWATKMVNACLRRLEREGISENPKSIEAKLNHPYWLVKAIKTAYPDNSESIFFANNTPAPLTLRVNRLRGSLDAYLEKLEEANIAARRGEHSPDAIILDKPVPVSALPGFSDGDASVQDEAAQLCSHALQVEKGMRVLDACAAPGGKSCHLLELTPEIDLTCLDKEETRNNKIHENLSRLDLKARVITASAEATEQWWDGRDFQRILADVPCSSTGVIRRHPDIKILRTPEEVASLLPVQSEILNALWTTLAPGGKLLYSTCSILPEENELQIAQFLEGNKDAKAVAIPAFPIARQQWGYQTLPGNADMDGFYYCLLEKADS